MVRLEAGRQYKWQKNQYNYLSFIYCTQIHFPTENFHSFTVIILVIPMDLISIRTTYNNLLFIYYLSFHFHSVWCQMRPRLTFDKESDSRTSEHSDCVLSSQWVVELQHWLFVCFVADRLYKMAPYKLASILLIICCVGLKEAVVSAKYHQVIYAGKYYNEIRQIQKPSV